MRGDRRQFDVLVLGGGTAGCVVAARLSEHGGRRVCLVEAGPDYGHFRDGGWPADILDGRVDAAESHDWGYVEPSWSSRARIVGGCSAHNGCAVVWPAVADLDDWAEVLHDGWSYRALEPELVRAERMLRTRPTPRAELEPIRSAFVEAGLELGLPYLTDFNAPNGSEGIGTVPVNAVGPIRWNTAFAYLDEARERPNIEILGDTLVDRIAFEGTAAIGAHLRRKDEDLYVTAGTIVVAAGVYGTAAILQRSGVGPADVLERLGIECVADRPGVGEGLANHPYAHISFEPGEELRRAYRQHLTTGAPVGMAMARMRAGGAAEAWDLMLGSSTTPERNSAGAPIGVQMVGIIAALSKPRSRGRVRIVSKDSRVLPRIDHGFLSDPDGSDLALLVEGMREARRLSRMPAFQRLVGAELAPGRDVDGDRLVAWLTATPLGENHPAGTCRMGGSDDLLAVVDAAGHLHGTSNVVVADASIFPTIPRANIFLTVVAAAERIAAGLARGSSSGGE